MLRRWQALAVLGNAEEPDAGGVKDRSALVLLSMSHRMVLMRTREVLIEPLAQRADAASTLISTHDQAFTEAIGVAVISLEMLGTAMNR